ncbi:MAG: hypothetical protein ACXWAT_00080 [Methylobacter sp.]
MAIESGNLLVHEVTSDKELYDLWPRIRDGINAIEKRCNGLFYRPEDVYHEIKKGDAKLLIGTINNVYQGFFVVKITTYPDGAGLHLWTAHNAGKDKDFLANFFKVIDQIATLAGVMRVSYSSSRNGWGKVSNKLGYKPVASIHYYEREVTP